MFKTYEYTVMDIQTKETLKTFPENKKKFARLLAERKNQAYGAVRFTVALVPKA